MVIAIYFVGSLLSADDEECPFLGTWVALLSNPLFIAMPTIKQKRRGLRRQSYINKYDKNILLGVLKL